MPWYAHNIVRTLSYLFRLQRCATTAFPHPLVNVTQSNAERGLTNYLSYPLTDIMTWQGSVETIPKDNSILT